MQACHSTPIHHEAAEIAADHTQLEGVGSAEAHGAGVGDAPLIGGHAVLQCVQDLPGHAVDRSDVHVNNGADILRYVMVSKDICFTG